MLFPGGIEASANGALILSAAAALLYLVIVNQRPTPLRSVVKTIAVGFLAALAFIENGPALLFVALLLSAVGDAFLSRDGEAMFLGGLASFLAAHLAYVGLFLGQGGGIAHLLEENWRIGLAAAIAVSSLIVIALVWRRVRPTLALPMLAYTLAALAMSTAALTLDRPWLVIGAVLFLASDALLATERFLLSAVSPHRGWLRQLVWILYYVAQATIALSILL
jgi:uncharacterized membrane protein YhhN